MPHGRILSPDVQMLSPVSYQCCCMRGGLYTLPRWKDFQDYCQHITRFHRDNLRFTARSICGDTKTLTANIRCLFADCPLQSQGYSACGGVLRAPGAHPLHPLHAWAQAAGEAALLLATSASWSSRGEESKEQWTTDENVIPTVVSPRSPRLHAAGAMHHELPKPPFNTPGTT